MKLSRRQFAGAASAAVAAALVGRRAGAQPAPNDPAGESLPPTRLAAPAQAEADARLQLILARWNARLSPADRRLVAHLCAETQGALEAVRAVALDITDEPAPIFVAVRRKH